MRLCLLSLACVAGLIASPTFADVRKADVEGVQDGDLLQAIERVVGESKRPAQSRFEARRRAAEAAEDAITVLRSEGYYDYQVIPDVEESNGARRPVIRIAPGERFTVAEATIDWANGAPDPETQAAAVAALSLPRGAPGRAAEVVAAESRALAALQKAGYADATAQPREVVADHADRTLRPTYRIDARAQTKLDGVRVRTRGRTETEWVRGLAPWKEGETYKPDDVAELERRLLDTGVYRSVNVSLAKEPDARGLRPIIVGLADRPKATIEAQASYSTDEGVGVGGRYTMYNRLNRADTISLGAQFAQILTRADAQLTLPHWRRPNDTLRLTTQIYQDDTDAYREASAGVRAELTRRFGKTSYRTIGLALDASDNDEKRLVEGAIVGVERQLFAVTGIAAWTLDRSDDPLQPTKGWKVDGRFEPTASAGDDTAVYLKAVGQASTYFAFGKQSETVLAARVRIGSILGAETETVPAPRRFFAGGGGSVRGYGYQKVGPQFPDDTPIGGRSLVETSFEVRHRFGEKWGAVAFVDAGAISDEMYPGFETASVGAGVGVRYDLGFAPIRADLGFPLNRREGDAAFQLYLSIGQAF